LGDGTLESLTPLQQEFVTRVSLWKIEREIQLAGFEVQQQPERISVTEYADRLKIVRENNPGALEYINS